MLIEQPSKWLRRLYPGALWRVNPDEKAVYLTFDDGPIPEVTPWVLDLLERYGVKATFFMVGDNICKYPEIFRLVVEKGHRMGNHTFNHIRGFSRKYFTSYSYLENTEKAYDLMREQMKGLNCIESQLRPLLFRPPHGHMGWAQYITLKRRYRIVMWDLVTRDYSKKLRGPQVLANVLRYTRNGSIITFHDSLKSWQNGNLQYALPRAIEFFMEEGYQMKML